MEVKWKLQLGANLQDDKTWKFAVWAPNVPAAALVFVSKGTTAAEFAMHPAADGFFSINLQQLPAADYYYAIQGKLLPDPVSKWQPYGVHGPSRVYDESRFSWSDANWTGIPLQNYIIYELHIGTFTPEGTFTAAISKIPYLKDLGITAVELMPVVEFPGERNWGYDGVNLFAPHHAYGGPEGLKALIDALHKAGIAVILDVVYNHFGPEGNYLAQYGPYFHDRYQTPWGDAINYDDADCSHVRRYIIDNALYWLSDFHVDALRLDAIHAIYDQSAAHILAELKECFAKQAKLLGRQACIIAESDLNDIKVIAGREKGGYGLDAQWSDDWHHALHALIAKDAHGFFQDFGSLAQLAKAIQEGFVYDGGYSIFRKKDFGSSSKDLPGCKHIICMQNHDQVGNASLGARLHTQVSEKLYLAAALLLFCSPNIPLIFMGQEWNAESPFYFFTQFSDRELALNVRKGYQQEFNLADEDLFDPQNSERYRQSVLNWRELEQPSHKRLRDFYKQMIALKKSHSCLANCCKDLTKVLFEGDSWLAVEREGKDGSKALLLVNFTCMPMRVPLALTPGTWQLAIDTGRLDWQETIEISHPQQQAISLGPEEAKLFILTPALVPSVLCKSLS